MRYLRHTQIEGFSQDAIHQLRVLVIGAGAIGNEVVKNLALLGVGHIGLYDFDRVETHNLTRSVLFREADIGRNKVDAVAARARELDPGLTIVPVHGDIHDTLALDDVSAANCVIACTDNFEARIRINQMCLLADKPWINTGIDARYGTVEVFPASQDVCYECTLPASVYEKLAERRSCGGLMRAAREQRVVPTTTITTSMTAALACNELLGLTGCDTRLGSGSLEHDRVASRLFIDTLAGTSQRIELSAADLCAGCGTHPRGAKTIGQCATGDQLLAVQGVGPQDTIVLSDRLIWACACEKCGPSDQTRHFLGRRAAGVTDAITVCARCGEPNVKVDIKEQFALGELAERYKGQSIPAAWGLIDEDLIILNAENRAPTSPES